MSPVKKLALATGNPGKLREYRELLEPAGFEIVPVEIEVEETGATYAENATLKANAAFAATGLPSLGDDSGGNTWMEMSGRSRAFRSSLRPRRRR